uniref:Uncharacterized protein n=1 Tax=Sphaerodactylus townsendi TaxID=933632 RepID=A0ACB8EV33_9SAUR
MGSGCLPEEQGPSQDAAAGMGVMVPDTPDAGRTAPRLPALQRGGIFRAFNEPHHGAKTSTHEGVTYLQNYIDCKIISKYSDFPQDKVTDNQTGRDDLLEKTVTSIEGDTLPEEKVPSQWLVRKRKQTLERTDS